ncbi:MAG: phosphatase PAP2 family protein [Clostridia bacterium]|nr:phosphatase PAP2 family protein [Clostridia bacterium]MBQ8415786.1 phosphatase PAP2 family protein [Clostridia bacterium]
MTAFAHWLNTAFADFDYGILEFYHRLAEKAGGFFTPFMSVVSLISDLGFLCFAVAFVLLLFPKTRKVGFCMIAAVGIGAILNNVILKEWIARPRPFQSEVAIFRVWWESVGAPHVGEFAFPSGHTAAAVSGMAAMGLMLQKKYIWIPVGLAYSILVGASRNYLMVHYPTDVMGAFLSGFVGALAAVGLTVLCFRFAQQKRDKAFFRFLLNADIRSLWSKKRNQTTSEQ